MFGISESTDFSCCVLKRFRRTRLLKSRSKKREGTPTLCGVCASGLFERAKAMLFVLPVFESRDGCRDHVTIDARYGSGV